MTARGYVDSAPSQMQGGNEELQPSIHSEPVDIVFTLNCAGNETKAWREVISICFTFRITTKCTQELGLVATY